MGLGGILSPLHQSLYHKVGAKYLEGKGHILSLFLQGLIQHLPTMGAQKLFCEGQGEHETKYRVWPAVRAWVRNTALTWASFF